jgi:glucokinase
MIGNGMDALGFDIGGTRIKAARVDPAGEIVAMRSRSTPLDLAGMRDAAASITAELSPGDSPLLVGIGCRGIIDHVTTRVEALPGSTSFLEGTVLSDLFPPGSRVAADNDARVAMAGEMLWGAARGCRNAMMVTLGTGVGGAILAEGRLLRGASGVAGHLGHITLDPDGPVCICGNRGCLETFFSARAIESAAFAVAHRGCDSALTRRYNESGGKLACEEVFAAAAAGDPLAAEIVERANRVLGGAIAGLVHTIDPEVVIVGGQISEAGRLLFDGLEREVWQRTKRLLRRDVPIVRSQLADPSGVCGAAALILNESAHIY